MDLILVAIAVWAFRGAVLHLQGKLRDSRKERIAEREKQLAPRQLTPVQRKATAARHDTGWWASEIAHGFPVALHGWHAGWVAHQAAAEQQRAIRDEHKGIRDSFRAVRRQGKANLQVIEREPQPLTRVEMKAKLQAGSPPARVAEQPEAQPPSPIPPEPAAAGSPVPAAAVPPPTAPVQGEPMPTTATPETTYTQDISRCNKIIAECDIELARLRAQRMVAWVEEMVAAGLDPQHTSMAADLADRIEEQIKATQQVHDETQALRDSIRRTHQAGHDYHSSAPAGGASREYLRD